MATRANTSVAKKETKKATPLANSRSKPTNNAVGATTAAANKVKPTPSSPLPKAVPNYLRHTTSSSKSDPLAPIKKTINEDSSHNVARRRSFDRPPSAIRNQKSLISPDPRDKILSRERQLATRSSSFSPSSSSSKVLGSPKPVLERNAKSLKPVRSPQPVFVKRSSSFSKTVNSPRNVSNIASPHSTKSSSTSGCGTIQETKQETVIKDQSSIESNNDESEDVHMQKDEINEDIVVDFVQGSENSKDGTATEEDSEVIDTFLKLKLIDEDDHINHTIEEDGSQEKEESINHPEEEGTTDDSPQIETEPEEEILNEVSAEEGEKKNEESEDIIVESKEADETEVKVGESPVKVGESPVKVDEIQVKVEEKAEEKEVNNGSQRGQGKRESPAAYNDVIEETKNRLLEKRKNKVKALVGAFETVIDYETAANK
ncbi:Plant calmodulin-binding protein-related [Euphorbia peplus]|nr:Plant calmodulin-binding protein-related [Euphorbia peplus]